MLRIMPLAILVVLSSVAVTDAQTSQPTDAAVAGNLFAADLYAQLRGGEGNICVSPLSISSALDMAAAGAAGKTRDQMLAVLHWTQSPDELPAAVSALAGAISGAVATTSPDEAMQDRPRVSIANALFSQSGYPYRQQFLDVLGNQYAAPLQDVDFIHQPQEACERINHWAAEQTHDKIKSAIPRSAITALTRLILINAIYFKGEWEHTFNKAATRDQPFYVSGTKTIDAPTMQQKQTLGYMENGSMQAVEIPYRGDFSLVILLPGSRDGLGDLEKSLTGDELASWIAKVSPQQVQLFLPKFKFEGSYQLSGTLAKMGMADAFNPRTADFSAMSDSEKLSIDQVIHKTFIDVDEAGTEAAAVTAVTVAAMAMRAPPPEPPKVFRADHPFMYVLRHRPTGAILFLGRVVNPGEK